MRLNDPHLEELCLRYFKGELNPLEEKEFLDWLEEDLSHKQLLADKANFWAAVHTPLFESGRERNYRQVLEPVIASPEKKRVRMNLKIWGSIAASILLFVVLGISVYRKGLSNGMELVAALPKPVYTTEITVPAGSRTKAMLPDGTQVWLNAGSTLAYQYDKEGALRRVALNGEAYFEVVSDSLHPFIVTASGFDVKVTGTRFNVKAYEEDDLADVALLFGKVSVSLAGMPADSSQFILHPDRHLSFNHRTKEMEIEGLEGRDVTAWINGHFEFSEQLFPLLAKDLERKYNVTIRINSKWLKRETFSGKILSDDTLDEVLRDMDVEQKYTWTVEGNVWTIRDKW